MKTALRHWSNGDRLKCLEEMEGLKQQSPHDATVLSNFVVAHCNVEDPKSLEETAAALLELQERAGVDGGSHENHRSDEVKDEVSPVVLYNRAVVLYHQERWEDVVAILEPLFQKVYALDDGLATGICLLCLESYLQKKQPTRCREPLEFLENLLPLEERSKIPMVWEEPNISASDVGSSEEESLPEDQDIETSFLAFPCVSKLNLTVSEPDAVNGIDTHCLPKTEDVAPLAAFYRARILVSLGNAPLAKAVLKDLLEQLTGCLPALFLRTEIALIQNKLEEAAVWLDRCIRAAPDGSPVRSALLNNLGAVHHRLKNGNLACLCFSKALESNPNIHSNDQQRTLYNMGLVSLRQGEYECALSQFKQSAPAMFSEPCLWIRMAECCLALFTSTSSFEPELDVERPAVATKGLPAIVVLPASQPPDGKDSNNEEWLRLSYSYLLNALVLVKHEPSVAESAEKQLLRVAVHVKLAFVTLSLNQPERCLMFIEKLRLLSISDNNMALSAAMYEAEALCLLDRSQEAAERLRAFVEAFAQADFPTQHLNASSTDPMRRADMISQMLMCLFVQIQLMLRN